MVERLPVDVGVMVAVGVSVFRLRGLGSRRRRRNRTGHRGCSRRGSRSCGPDWPYIWLSLKTILTLLRESEVR